MASKLEEISARLDSLALTIVDGRSGDDSWDLQKRIERLKAIFSGVDEGFRPVFFELFIDELQALERDVEQWNASSRV